MFSGGTYPEVCRWLWNFLISHAKRVDPRVEAEVDADDEREGKSYGVRLRFGDRLSPVWEFDYKEVADNRGSLEWCRRAAEEVVARARELVGRADNAGAR